MDEAAVLPGDALHVVAGGVLDGLGAPEGAHVGEHLGLVGQQLHEQHAQTVEHVVLGGEDVGLAGAVVVKGGVQHGLGEVAVRIEVRPLALALEAAGDGVVAHGLFLVALGQVLVAVHQILDDQVHLQGELPVLVLLLAALLELGGVLVKALDDVLVGPGLELLVLGLVVDALGHAADDFHLVHGLDAHAQVVLDELGIDDGAADAHADGTDLQVALAAHGGHGHGCAGEAEQLLLDVGGDGGVVRVLNLMAVDAEGRQALLGMGGQNGGQIYRAGALGAVEAPHALDGVAVHVHGLGAIAPAGGHGQGDGHAIVAELFLAGGGLGHAADGGVRDDDLHGLTVGVAQVFFKELLGGQGHVHGLLLQAFAHLQHAAAAVDGGANADDRIGTQVSVLCHSNLPPVKYTKQLLRIILRFNHNITLICLTVLWYNHRKW